MRTISLIVLLLFCHNLYAQKFSVGLNVGGVHNKCPEYLKKAFTNSSLTGGIATGGNTMVVGLRGCLSTKYIRATIGLDYGKFIYTYGFETTTSKGHYENITTNKFDYLSPNLSVSGKISISRSFVYAGVNIGGMLWLNEQADMKGSINSFVIKDATNYTSHKPSAVFGAQLGYGLNVTRHFYLTAEIAAKAISQMTINQTGYDHNYAKYSTEQQTKLMYFPLVVGCYYNL